MARKGKARKNRVRFLFVRGESDETYITVAPAPVKDAKLAKLIDEYARRTRNLARAKVAFFVDGDVRVIRLTAETLYSRPPRPPK